MKTRSFILLAACLGLAMLLGACGNKGALYLPDDQPRVEGAPLEPEGDEVTGPDDQGDSDEDDDL
ncbi:lipoprotein [Marinihelvus fidelis]|uniref:Lipoprotein n=1 Tax=Marinihelvus fidelis TaxID=2613842 RepID=A0A5N0T7B7_9GAMM|nr:lipoprotein [Marinihelvus fidelis]KAA9130850.1 lipoprotein [Marinihelvus fidelis]